MGLSYVRRIFQIFCVSGKESSLYILMFAVSAILEVVSIGFLALFVLSLVREVDMIGTSVLYDISTKNLMMLLILVFGLKTIVYLTIQKKIYSFSFGKQKLLMMSLYPLFFRRGSNFGGSSTDIVQEIVFDTGILVNKSLVPILKVMSEIIIVCSILIYLLFTHPIFILTVFGCFLLVNKFLFNRIRKKTVDLGRDFTSSNRDIVGIVESTAKNRKEIIVHRSLSFFESKLRTALETYTSTAALFSLFSVMFRPLLEFILLIIIIVLIALSRNDPSSMLNALVTLGAAGIRLIPAASSIVTLTTQMRFATAALERLDKNLSIFNGKLKDETAIRGFSHKDWFSSLCLKNVRFRYSSSSRWIIDDINLRISKGEAVCFVGESGVGKSTLVDLLIGVKAPQCGTIEVLLDNGSVGSDLVGLAGYVPQAPFIFSANIVDNITLGHKTENNVLANVIDLCGVSKILRDLPQGEYSLLGDGGIELSGGQKQRIAIARALIHSRGVLILDEPTAALDKESEVEIIDLLRLLKDKTAIVIITHSQYPKIICDKVYELSAGKIF